MQKSIPLLPGHCYHVYNRGNNRENIFVEERNYAYFLRLYAKYINPVAETFAYCLMRNHFHLLVRIRGETCGVSETPQVLTPMMAGNHFSNFFNSYAKSINKAYNRTGSLFQKGFGRIEVTSDHYFLALVRYIHFNPQKHGFVTEFRAYPYSSYTTFQSSQPTQLSRQWVLDLFGGLNAFMQFHKELADERSIQHLIEDDVD